MDIVVHMNHWSMSATSHQTCNIQNGYMGLLAGCYSALSSRYINYIQQWYKTSSANNNFGCRNVGSYIFYQIKSVSIQKVHGWNALLTLGSLYKMPQRNNGPGSNVSLYHCRGSYLDTACLQWSLLGDGFIQGHVLLWVDTYGKPNLNLTHIWIYLKISRDITKWLCNMEVHPQTVYITRHIFTKIMVLI